MSHKKPPRQFLTVRLLPEVRHVIEKVAQEQDRSLTYVVTAILTEWAEKHRKKDSKD